MRPVPYRLRPRPPSWRSSTPSLSLRSAFRRCTRIPADHHRAADRPIGRRVLQLGRHGALVWSLAVLPDGSAAVTAGDDGKCKVWDLESGQERLVFSLATVRSCGLAPQSHWHARRFGRRRWHRPPLECHIRARRTVDQSHRARLVGQHEPAGMGGGRCEGRVRAVLARHGTTRDGELLGRHGNSAEHLLWIGSGLVSAAVDGSIAAHRCGGRRTVGRCGGSLLRPRGRCSSQRARTAPGHLGLHPRLPRRRYPIPGTTAGGRRPSHRPLVAVTGDGGLIHIVEMVNWSGLW
jgi:hypothetical protein